MLELLSTFVLDRDVIVSSPTSRQARLQCYEDDALLVITHNEDGIYTVVEKESIRL